MVVSHAGMMTIRFVQFFLCQHEYIVARYKRVLPTEDDKESPIGRSFYSCYQVDNKADLEKKLNDIEGLEYKWMPDGCLQVITEPIPAIRMIEQQHNHGIYQWTFHNSVIAAFVGWQDCRNDRLKSVCFGNNEEMDLGVLQSIANFSKCKCVHSSLLRLC
jgi:hypothetical protein